MLPLTHKDKRSLSYRIKGKLYEWKRLIFSDKNSRNLFLFLLLNLSFAFVELFYGIATNSLGKSTESGEYLCFKCLPSVVVLQRIATSTLCLRLPCQPRPRSNVISCSVLNYDLINVCAQTEIYQLIVNFLAKLQHCNWMSSYRQTNSNGEKDELFVHSLFWRESFTIFNCGVNYFNNLGRVDNFVNKCIGNIFSGLIICIVFDYYF